MSVRVRYSNELYHHGVKGQVHGVRKYQNEDGSLTPLGRIHYGIGQGKEKAKAVLNSAANKAKSIGSSAASKGKIMVSYAKNAAVKSAPKLKSAAKTGLKVGAAAGAGAAAIAGGALAGAAIKKHNRKTERKERRAERREIRREKNHEKFKKRVRKAAVKTAIGAALAITGIGAYGGAKLSDARYKKKADKHFTEAVNSIEEALKKKAGEMGIENPTALQGLKGYKYNPRRGPLRADMTPRERYDWWTSVLTDEPEYQEAVDKVQKEQNRQAAREQAYWEMANDPNYHGTAQDIYAELDRREKENNS